MKKILCFAIPMLIAAFVTAQNTAYVKTANNGIHTKIEKVSSGGYITAGYDSAYKIQVMRYNDNFDRLWVFKLTDSRVAGFFPSIRESLDGNFYLMTSSNEHGGSTLIVKLNPAGSPLWMKNYHINGGNLSSFALSAAAADNGFLFGGGQCAMSNDIIKCDASGNIIWQYQFLYPLATGVQTCWSIIPDGNGYVVSTGYNTNSLLTFRLDAGGNLGTYTAYTYSSKQIIPTRIVKLNHTGGYAIMGNYNSTNNNKTEFVAILNSNLSMNTFCELTVTYDQFVLNDIVALNNGRQIAVTGSIYHNSVFNTGLILLSSSGNVLAFKRSEAVAGPNKNVEFYGIAASGSRLAACGGGFSEGSVVALTDSMGNGLCNDQPFSMTNVHPTLTLQSGTMAPAASLVVDSMVNYVFVTHGSQTKTVHCGSLSEVYEHQANESVSVFPNPTSESIQISGLTSSGRAMIYNIQGRCMMNVAVSQSVNKLGISHLPAGCYYVQVVYPDGTRVVSPFVKY